MALMEATPELDGVYGTSAILAQFLSCLKPKTQVSVRQAKPNDIWEAINAAQEWDPLLFESEKNRDHPNKGGFLTPGRASLTPRGGGTPRGRVQFQFQGGRSPPGQPAVNSLADLLASAGDAELAALGFQRTGHRGGNDDVVYRGPYTANNPPPKLTQAWRDWCRANKACFGCRAPGSFTSTCRDGCRIFPRDRPRVNAVEPTGDLIDLREPLNE